MRLIVNAKLISLVGSSVWMVLVLEDSFGQMSSSACLASFEHRMVVAPLLGWLSTFTESLILAQDERWRRA